MKIALLLSWYLQFREGFQAIEKCVADAGDDLQSVMTCTKGFTEA